VHGRALGLDCAYEPAADGRWRCPPAYPAVGQRDDTEYLDAACTKPFYRHFPGCTGNDPAPTRVRDDGDACSVRVVTRGALVKPAFVYRVEGAPTVVGDGPVRQVVHDADGVRGPSR
jgi:hypothetical protein